ncbi:hypothetical protein [Leptolyngbya sp. KIOST-1]|uniref:hypothetical protein n=1 Tax=Leptolyngbya sp. KIOST-1 TaxID=1229172 RepID=UPI0006902FA7|nr:hypothetical protein [Leptolyngbya sp. KIOST-1]
MTLLTAAVAILFFGDFLSTFCYHIPEHVFGKLHLSTHHAGQQTFRHYAVLSPTATVLLDGLLGAIPYIVLGLLLLPLSPWGVALGLSLGQAHVWWRHTTALGWQTPAWLRQGLELIGSMSPL